MSIIRPSADISLRSLRLCAPAAVTTRIGVDKLEDKQRFIRTMRPDIEAHLGIEVFGQGALPSKGGDDDERHGSI